MVTAALLPFRRKALAVDDLYDGDTARAELTVLFTARYAAMLRAVHEVVKSAFPEVEDFRLDDPATRRILHEAAARVVRIDETTRQAIAQVLQQGQERGYSTQQIAAGVPADGYAGIDGLFTRTWGGRAETIARTELQQAQLSSAYDRYHATGLVDEVELRDGGLLDSDGFCAARNGTRAPLTHRVELAHPRCTLVIVPVVAERLAPEDAPDAPPAEFKPAKTMDDAAAYARSLGVETVRYGKKYLAVANEVNRGLWEVSQAGLPVPKWVEIDPTVFRGLHAKNAPAQFERIYERIQVNPKSEFWKDAPSRAKQQAESGFWSEGSASHPLRHEIGHMLHYQADRNRFVRLSAGDFTQEQRTRIERAVSRYALTDPREFVAEVFAQLTSGPDAFVSERILNWYRAFGGVMPKEPA
jgi:hypothetical protein